MDEQALREGLRSEAAEHAFDPAAVGRAVERGRAHRRRRRTALLAVAPVVALTAAGGVAAVLRMEPSDDGAEVAAAPVQLLTQPPPEGPVVHMQALLSGTLTVTENGCLALAVPGMPVVPVAWPYGWTADREDDGRALLYDDSGMARAREGDAIGIAGGFLDADAALAPVDPAQPCALGENRYFHASGEGLEPVPLD